MNFSFAEFRHAVQSPRRYVEMAKRPKVPQEGGNPQRPLFLACVESYFDSGRDPNAPFEELDRRLRRAARRQPEAEGRDANAVAVRLMLTRFLAMDDGEPDPSVVLPRSRACAIGRHVVTLSPSLLYESATSHYAMTRHLWTENDFSLSRPYSRLVAIGFLLHAEQNGNNRLGQVQFWHLRTSKAAAWRLSDLRPSIPSLVALLDSIAVELGGFDPGKAA